MKLEKDDRIISNADYEKLVGLAELHERAISEILREIVSKELVLIHRYISTAQNSILDTDKYFIGLQYELESKKHLITIKNKIIQEKNAEIARLKQPWWKIF